MMQLVCALVGVEGGLFPVRLDDGVMIGYLKDAIKEKNKRRIQCDAAELHLFLAKMDDGTWLESSTDDVKKLKKGEKTGLIETMTREENELQGESGLSKVLKEMPPPSTDQIHVLVVVPPANMLVGNSTTPTVPQDSSKLWLKRYLENQIPSHSLPAVDALSSFIQEELPVKIGMQRYYLQKLIGSPMDVCPTLVPKIFTEENASPCARFDRIVMTHFETPVGVGLTENSFICFWDTLIRTLLDYVFNHGRIDRDTNRYSSTGLKRPDFIFTLNGVCVFRGEENDPNTNIEVPRDELRDKLIWSYGDVPYMFGYAVAGYYLELYALVRPVNGVYGPNGVDMVQLGSFQLDKFMDRIRFLLALLKLSLLFQAIADICPAFGRYEYMNIVLSNGVIVRLNPTVVAKDFPEQQMFDTVAMHLKNVYSRLNNNNVPNVDRLVTTDALKRRIVLEPRGMQTKPSTLLELFGALQDVLNTLVVLHGASWMHRDIRWPNVMKRRDSSATWFLIDFVDSAESPQDSAYNLNLSKKEHAPELAERGSHDTAVDIWSVGYLIVTSGDVYRDWFDLGERTTFVEQLMDNDPSKRPSARQALDQLEQLYRQYRTHGQKRSQTFSKCNIYSASASLFMIELN